MSLTAVVHGFSFEFDSFEDYEAWYAETSHKLPEEPIMKIQTVMKC